MAKDRPALVPAVCVLAGCALGPRIPEIGAAALAIGCGLVGSLCLVLKRAGCARAAAAFACATLAVLSAWSAQTEWARYDEKVQALFPQADQPRETHVIGEVVAPIETTALGELRIVLRGAPQSGPGSSAGPFRIVLLATVAAEATRRREGIRPGSRLRVWCRLSPPAEDSIPADHAVGRVKSDRLIELLDESGPGRLGARMGWAARRRLDAAVDPAEACRPLIDAMLFGLRSALPPKERRTLRDAGMLPIVAISGLHVGICVWLLIGALRRLSLGRLPLAATVLVLLLFYAPAVGGRTSVVRAAAAAALLVAGRAAGRQGDALNTLALLAALLALDDPALVFRPGFQLTFVATAGILLHTAAHADARKAPPGPAAALRVSVAAFTATAPIVAWHFGRLAPIAVASNVAATPLCGAILVAGYGAVAFADLPWIGLPLGTATRWAALAMLKLAALAAESPAAALPVVRPPLLVVVLHYAALALVGLRTRGVVRSLARSGLLGCLVWMHTGPPPPERGALEVAVLDVGQGLAVALHAPGGKRLLIDTGGRARSTFDPGERVVVPRLIENGGRRLDALLLTHEDVDHVGGAFAVLRDLEVGELWVGPGYHRSERLLRLIDLARSRGVAVLLVESGRRESFDGVPLEVLSPGRSSLSDDDNERSVVVRIGREPFRLIVPGDLERSGERELVRTGGERLRAEALVVAHHGSRNGSSRSFLDATRPTFAIVSAGSGNPFGHPHEETERRLRDAGAVILRTDRLGTVTLRAAGGSWQLLPAQEM